MNLDDTIVRDLTRQLWAAFDGDPDAVDDVGFTGAGNVRSPFPVADFAAAVFASTGLAIDRLMAAAGHGSRPVTVDRRVSTAWFDIPFAPTRYLDVPEPHGLHAKGLAEFQTRDSRWIRVQATFPTLRRRMLTALGLPDGDLAGVAKVVGEMTADEAEQVLVAAGAAVAQAHTLQEWRAHPQGSAVAREPIVAVRPTTPGLGGWSPHPDRPLLGVRVLDFSRVVAAPMATRFLAALGADVLRIDVPGSDESTFGNSPSDVMLGKRWALLDVRTPDGNRRYQELLASADVLVHSYRPGVVDSFGFDEDERAALRPGLVEVALNAYGWTGPWQQRRGFDTLVQYSSGIAASVSAWANEDPAARLPINSLGHLVDADRPRHLPVEALDFGTGYQVAAAALCGLARRLETGHGSISKLSLARSAHLLTSAPAPDLDREFALPVEVPFDGSRVWSAAGRPSRRIEFPLAVSGVPLFWERPAEQAGASAPVWSSCPPRWAAAQ